MSEEFFNQSEDSRDGFRSQDEENAKGNGRFESGHTPRPRINRNFRQAGSSEYGNQRGYGMQSIAQIAEKTGGSMEYESRDGVFTVNVLLNRILSEEE